MRHVRGCQALLRPAVQDLDVAANRDLSVFLLESHGYFATMATLCGEEDERVHVMAIDFCEITLPQIHKRTAFGAMFAYDPLAIIYFPRLLQLASNTHDGYLRLEDRHELPRLRKVISSAGHAPLVALGATEPSMSSQDTAIVSFKAAVLNLKADNLLNPDLDPASLEPLIVKAMGLLQLFQNATDTSYGLLPYLVLLGSYLQDPLPQRLLISYFKSFTSEMPLQQRGIDLLEWLWADTSNALLGPEALKRTAKAHGVSAFLC